MTGRDPSWRDPSRRDPSWPDQAGPGPTGLAPPGLDTRAVAAAAREFARLRAGAAEGEDLVCTGADLAPSTLVAAYTTGLFPMGLGPHGARPLGWWSPDPRGVLPLDGLRVSRSLRRSLRGFELRIDTAFDDVVRACADPCRSGRWITGEVAHAYRELHGLGLAHSVEAWRDGRLVGGLYGLALGGLFAGESMFHCETDASKAALVGLVRLLRADGDGRRLLDVQWRTDHLATLGVVEVPRQEYLRRLALALRVPGVRFEPPQRAGPCEAGPHRPPV